ncbi:MAG: Alginate lyase [Verrucomicrobia bacterium]|nr:Alginate lyase [Verrucomicrobiota bacterium]
MILPYLLLLAASLSASGPAGDADPRARDRLADLAAKAPAALRAPIMTVVDKPQASPSGNAHDYVSFARYYWPDPGKPDGLPYVSRDGHHNEEQVARGDHRRLWSFAENVEALAAAWHTHRDAAAARRAGEWLRAWFIAPATRMNPNLDYAQIRLGHGGNRGSKSGVIDARCLSQVIHALLLLRGSPAFSADEEAVIRTWFKDYLDWLTTAANARDEHAAKNNHGSWFLAQVIPIARYTGRGDLARRFCEEDRARIASQINSDGSQPEEMRRADALSYSAFNLEAQFQIARLAEDCGIDLWNYTAPTGASLRRALEYVRPYNTRPETWPANQNARLEPGFLDPLLAEAKAVWPDFAAADGR